MSTLEAIRNFWERSSPPMVSLTFSVKTTWKFSANDTQKYTIKCHVSLLYMRIVHVRNTGKIYKKTFCKVFFDRAFPQKMNCTMPRTFFFLMQSTHPPIRTALPLPKKRRGKNPAIFRGKNRSVSPCVFIFFIVLLHSKRRTIAVQYCPVNGLFSPYG